MNDGSTGVCVQCTKLQRAATNSFVDGDRAVVVHDDRFDGECALVLVEEEFFCTRRCADSASGDISTKRGQADAANLGVVVSNDDAVLEEQRVHCIREGKCRRRQICDKTKPGHLLITRCQCDGLRCDSRGKCITRSRDRREGGSRHARARPIDDTGKPGDADGSEISRIGRRRPRKRNAVCGGGRQCRAVEKEGVDSSMVAGWRAERTERACDMEDTTADRSRKVREVQLRTLRGRSSTFVDLNLIPSNAKDNVAHCFLLIGRDCIVTDVEERAAQKVDLSAVSETISIRSLRELARSQSAVIVHQEFAALADGDAVDVWQVTARTDLNTPTIAADDEVAGEIRTAEQDKFAVAGLGERSSAGKRIDAGERLEVAA